MQRRRKLDGDESEDYITVKPKDQDEKEGVEYRRYTISQSYRQFYPEILRYTESITSGRTFHYMMWIMMRSDYINSARVSAHDERDYMKECGGKVSVRTLKGCTADLVKARILIRVDRGVYRVNPIPFWRSTRPERVIAIEALTIGGYELGPERRENKSVEEAENHIEQSAPESEEGSTGASDS